MANQTVNVLTPEFLMDVYHACIGSKYILSIVYEHLKKEYLPDRDFQVLHANFCEYYGKYKSSPTPGVLRQMVANNKGAQILVDDIMERSSIADTDALLENIERYIKMVRFKTNYTDVGKIFMSGDYEKAARKQAQFVEWEQNFNLRESEFVDVIGTFRSNFTKNREKHNAGSTLRPITRFYIDDLDEMNGGRDLRGQLSCFMASSGVGKSHAARHIGKSACQLDGLNVLHIQLEGSKAETVNAYSASLVSCNSFKYETGTIRDAEIARMEEELKAISGRLFVKSFPKFNTKVTTIDIKNCISDFKKRYKIQPDVVVIDSMDLLHSSSAKNGGSKEMRHERVEVANDLKDLADDESAWVVATYQSTIENREWINNEDNVLTEFNCSEAKGLVRPLTHLFTLNQSERERKEKIMRINVCKARFCEKIPVFKIATNYDIEKFYDRTRTMNINKLRG